MTDWESRALAAEGKLRRWAKELDERGFAIERLRAACDLVVTHRNKADRMKVIDACRDALASTSDRPHVIGGS